LPICLIVALLQGYGEKANCRQYQIFSFDTELNHRKSKSIFEMGQKNDRKYACAEERCVFHTSLKFFRLSEMAREFFVKISSVNFHFKNKKPFLAVLEFLYPCLQTDGRTGRFLRSTPQEYSRSCRE
jgi:hypothetical protein